MKYEMHMAIRKVYMKIFHKACNTCLHYDGRFGDDYCFECERSVRAVEYERRPTERVF